MWPSREPLVVPSLCFAAGIWAASCIPFTSFELAAAALAVAMCAALAARRAPRLLWLPWAALALLAGAAASLRQGPLPEPELDAADGELLLVAGCVVDLPAVEGPRTRFPIEIEPGYRVLAALTAREGEVLPPLGYGQNVELVAKVRKPRNFGNPGAFDYRRYLGRRQVYWLASARGVDKLRILPGRCGSALEGAVLASRDWITNRLKAASGSDPRAARLLPALLVGDDAGVERSWTEDFRRTGTYHALVISGLHITVVAGLALFLFRILALPLPATLLLSAALAWAYAVVANWQPPVVRSAAGFTLFLVARWFFRRGRLLNLLAATALAILAADPAQLFEPSFQLTFLAVAAIGAIGSPLLNRWPAPLAAGLRALPDPARDLRRPPHVAQFRIELRLLAETISVWTAIGQSIVERVLAVAVRVFFWIVEMTVISVVVQLCLGIALIAYFHQFSLTSAAANLTVAPLLTLAVPLALLTALTGWAWMGASAGALIGAASASAAWWAALEPLWRIPDPPGLAVVAVAACLLGFAVTALRGSRAVVLLASFSLAVAAMAALALVPFARPPRGRLELTAIDVGQGDALLLGFPDGQWMLVDAGGIPVFDPRLKPRLEIGEDVVSPYLWRRGIRRLDIVAATHLHDDHAAGLPAAIRNFGPREVWISRRRDGPLLEAIGEAARAVGARVLTRSETQVYRFGEAQLRILWPPPSKETSGEPANDDSLVFDLRYGKHRFLLTGDAGPEVERRLLENGRVEEIDVLKVAHHGGRSSTTLPFLDAGRPLFAVVSAGPGNTYGHPHPDTVGRLRSRGARLYRTDLHGRITIQTDGTRLSIATGPDSTGNLPALWEKLSY